MIKLKDIPQDVEFYFDGVRYRQFIRPLCDGDLVACFNAVNFNASYINRNEEVKPVVRAGYE